MSIHDNNDVMMLSQNDNDMILLDQEFTMDKDEYVYRDMLSDDVEAYDSGDLLYNNDEYYDDDQVVDPRCGHKGFNTCKLCMTAYGKLSRTVKHSTGLKVAHINVRSLYPKIDEIRYLLADASLDILCITEAWLDKTITDSQIKVNGYLVERNDRNRHGGGVVIYIRDTIDYDLREDLDHSNIESLWLQCKLSSDSHVLICALYRPPSATTTSQGPFLKKRPL